MKRLVGIDLAVGEFVVRIAFVAVPGRRQPVLAPVGLGDEEVVACAAVEDVLAVSAVEHVVTGPAVENVVAVGPLEDVVAGLAVDGVVAEACIDGVGLIGSSMVSPDRCRPEWWRSRSSRPCG